MCVYENVEMLRIPIVARLRRRCRLIPSRTFTFGYHRSIGRRLEHRQTYTVIQNIPFKISRHTTMFMANVF